LLAREQFTCYTFKDAEVKNRFNKKGEAGRKVYKCVCLNINQIEK